MCSSESFDKHWQFCNHYQVQDKEQFLHPPNYPVPNCIVTCPATAVSGNHWFIFYSIALPFKKMSYILNHAACGFLSGFSHLA